MGNGTKLYELGRDMSGIVFNTPDRNKSLQLRLDIIKTGMKDLAERKKVVEINFKKVETYFKKWGVAQLELVEDLELEEDDIDLQEKQDDVMYPKIKKWLIEKGVDQHNLMEIDILQLESMFTRRKIKMNMLEGKVNLAISKQLEMSNKLTNNGDHVSKGFEKLTSKEFVAGLTRFDVEEKYITLVDIWKLVIDKKKKN